MPVIDFSNGSVFKLQAADVSAIWAEITPLLVEGEVGIAGFKGIRDWVVMTNKRIIALNVQGITGKKKDFTSLPYSKIQAFSVETAGTLDLDSELELWFSGLGKVRLEFKGKVDIKTIGQTIASFVL